MPTVTATEVKAYAHCRNAMCPGYAQEEINGLREETSFSYGDNGGDGIFAHMPERSMVEFRFADPDEAPCHACKQPREVTGDPRPSYQPLSGHDPMFLATSGAQFDASVVNTPADARTAELEAKLALMQATIDKLAEGKD